MSFTHLHVHTEYSLLDGANKLDELIEKVKELNMDSIAITDHGTMYGVIEFYKKCKNNNIKPIIGIEMYMAPRTRFDKDSNLDRNPYHLTVLAMNNKGYENLVKLVSISNTEGFYYKPRIDMEILKKYNEGLIVLSGCLNGELSKNILDNDIIGATSKAQEFLEIFKDRYYLEIQSNGIKEQVLVNQNLISISKKLNIPLVATNDCHYLTKEDSFFHDVLLCIQTKEVLSEEKRMKMPTDEFYIKSEEEMLTLFKNYEEAVYNSNIIADRCNVDIEFGNTKLPKFDLKEDHFEYVKKLCKDNINKKYIDIDSNLLNKVNKRLEYELSVINKMGYIDYFLIVADFVKYAKDNNIAVGPGRGSGAGSIVAYLMDITDVDPIKYNLIFERFLNPERITMPDFDIDFCNERRDEVIDYVINKYGEENVASIITFGTMQARQAIRDTARVLEASYIKADSIAKLIPNILNVTIDEALELNEELNSMYISDLETKKIIDIAKKLEGMPRHISTHAAGIVITENKVCNYVPVCINQEKLSTEYTMNILEELGILKMDFLGLRTLTVIQNTIDMLKKEGIDVNISKEYNDKKTYKLLGKGITNGIFQLESEGVKRLMKDLKPDFLEDITVIISLYRPGPMDQIPRYIENKNEGKYTYTHKSLENILKVTYGCMVYQEQVMQIFRDLAGYSYAEADLVRRAMSKKKSKVLEKERVKFVDGCLKNNIDEISANEIFDEMYEFAKYAFNKAHATSYAILAYECAYLKANYTEYFMAAMMNSMLGNLNKIPKYINECKSLKIEVLKPDINKSFAMFKVDNGKIIFALETIKNISSNCINEIIKERENGEYKDFLDFLNRVNFTYVNKSQIESLIKAGCFDEIEKKYSRFDLLENLEVLVQSINSDRRLNFKNQINMFSGIEDSNPLVIKKSGRKYSKRDYLNLEKEMIGIYVSGHPLEEFKEYISSNVKFFSKDIDYNNIMKYNDKVVDVVGIITSKKVINTRSNKLMLTGEISDLYGSMKMIVFPSIYLKYSTILNDDTPFVFKCKISVQDEDIQLIVLNISAIKEEKKLYIKIPKDKTGLERLVIENIKKISLKYKGNSKVYIFYEETNKIKMLNNSFNINLKRDCLNELMAMFGEENIKITGS